jgi:ABC-type amino acid transport substrate-binding protein
MHRGKPLASSGGKVMNRGTIIKLAAIGALLSAVGAWTFAVPAAAEEESVLQKVKKTGVIKACIAQTNPESFKDAKTGEWKGINVDLIQEMAAWVKTKVEFVEVKWDTVILSLNRNDCDMFGGSLQYNAPRALEVSYIVPFWKKGSNLVVRKDAKRKFASVKEFDDASVTISAVAGTSDYELVRRKFPKAKLQALNVNSSIQVMDSVRRGDVDAAFVSSAAIYWWLDIPENSAWAVAAFPGQELFPASVGWAIRYGDPDWKSFLDAFSTWAVANGRVKELYDDYFAGSNPYK